MKLLNVANLHEGKLDTSNTSRYISDEEAYGRYKHFLVDEGDLIVASSGIKVEYFNQKMGFADKTQLPLCMNTSTIRFKVRSPHELDINYFMCFLKSDDFKKQLERQITGSAQLNFGPSHLKRMSMPLPPLAHQLEVAERIAHIDKQIDDARTVLSGLDNLVKSRFIEMFEHDSLPATPIEKITLSKMPNARKAFGATDLIKYIDISSIDSISCEVARITEYLLKDAPSRAQQCVSKGDLLVSTVRPNLKNIALVNLSDENLVASTGFCVLRCKECPPEYLKTIVRSERFTHDMCQLTTGANYPAIKNSDILKYQVPLPPKEDMDQFATFVRQVDKL